MAETKPKTENEKIDKTISEVAKFSKKIILTFDKYKKRKDLLQVILKDNKYYTLEQVDNELKKFMEGK